MKWIILSLTLLASLLINASCEEEPRRRLSGGRVQKLLSRKLGDDHDHDHHGDHHDHKHDKKDHDHKHDKDQDHDHDHDHDKHHHDNDDHDKHHDDDKDKHDSDDHDHDGHHEDHSHHDHDEDGSVVTEAELEAAEGAAAADGSTDVKGYLCKLFGIEC